MTQENPQDPHPPQRLAPAIRLLAHAVVFLGGAILLGLGSTAQGRGDIAMFFGAMVMMASGTMFLLTLFDKQ
jgi:hypothetical protein